MKKLLVAMLIGVFCLMGVNPVQATTFTFGDEAYYWAGWENGTVDDSRDYIHAPDFTGGGGETDDANNLKNLYFNYIHVMPDGGLGDVFIDTNADTYWDYVLAEGTVWEMNDQTLSAINSYDPINDADEVGPYILSNTYYDGDAWDLYRNDHPVQVNRDYLSDNSSDVGSFSVTDSGSVVNFDIDAALFFDPTNYALSFAPLCANDVAYVDPVPEPSTILLLGFGLIGLVLVGRKKRRF